MAIKKQSHDRKNESTKDNKCDKEFSLRIVVICLVAERSLENACMAFCTWNNTLKGNTPVYHSCASSIDSRMFSFSRETCLYSKDNPKTKMLLHSPKLLLLLALKPNHWGLRLSRLTVPGKSIDKSVLQSLLPLVILHLNPAQRHNPKQFPFKGESD